MEITERFQLTSHGWVCVCALAGFQDFLEAFRRFCMWIDMSGSRYSRPGSIGPRIRVISYF